MEKLLFIIIFLIIFSINFVFTESDINNTNWDLIPELIMFSKEYNPVYFLKEDKDERKTEKIEESFFWGHNGTKIRNLKAVIKNKQINIYFSFYSPVSEGLLIFLYLYKERDRGIENRYTIELSILKPGENGVVFLWEKDEKLPQRIGDIVTKTFYIQCSVSQEELTEYLGYDFIDNYSFDLTSCFFEKNKGFYEEFFFTTVYFVDILEYIE